MRKNPDRPPAGSNLATTANAAIKETLESIVIAFVLAFVFRAYVVEAFVIPTGSMAPTLLGEHLSITCSQCGYSFMTDKPSPHEDISAEELECPMCVYPNRLAWSARASAGDRILVLKYLYAFTEARRWDVVVFKAPHEPETNFIKRLVGKPGECVLIVEGNIYIKQATEPDWRIARKTHQESVQLTVFQPIYYSQYIPLDPSVGRRQKWRGPWEAVEGQWQVEDQRSYHHDAADRGAIEFEFTGAKPSTARWYPYNRLKKRMRSIPDDPIEDIRLSATFEPETDGLSIRLQTTARWNDSDGRLPLSVHIIADGTASLEMRRTSDESWHVIKSKPLTPFPTGRSRNVELWYVDQELSLWVDGERELSESFELSLQELKRRPALAADDYPQIAIEVEGAPVTLHRVELDRDIYYSSASEATSPGRSTLIKYGVDSHGAAKYAEGDSVCLDSDEFYCLGDNSPMSHDGRYWNRVNPWIQHRLFDGAPNKEGIVPRELMLGRAFFVYFPTPHRWRADLPAIFPNFGDMRFIY